MFFFFFFKQKTAYEMRISDWSSDVCSSDLHRPSRPDEHDPPLKPRRQSYRLRRRRDRGGEILGRKGDRGRAGGLGRMGQVPRKGGRRHGNGNAQRGDDEYGRARLWEIGGQYGYI